MSAPAVTEEAGRCEWGIATAVALAGVGIAVGSQLLLVAATLPLWYVAAASLGTSPPTTVAVHRELSVGDDPGAGGDADPNTTGGTGSTDRGAPASGDPGETVTVRTTVENVGRAPIVDVRVADSVPESLPVIAGAPRACVTLEPGENTTIEYDLELRRGDHVFGDASVRSRDLTGTVANTWTATASGDRKVRCVPTVDRTPLGSGTNDYAGEVPTDEGGSGVEFFSVREYEPGDPIRSIDWRRYAETRELATVEFRAERATRIVCVVDARSSQFRTAPDSRLPAASLSADAAFRTFETLVSAGHPTGLAGLFSRRYYDDLRIVPPGTGPETRQYATRLLEAIKEGDQTKARDIGRRRGDHAEELHRAIPGETQIYLFTSLVDAHPVGIVERLRSRGYVVHVVSPDITGGATSDAARLERIGRGNRLTEIRATGAHVVDWDLDRPLGLVLREAIGEVMAR